MRNISNSWFSRHIKEKYDDVNIIVEEDVAYEIVEDLGRNSSDDVTLYTGSSDQFKNKTDMIVTLGGDGTILHATSLFASGDVPPVLSFSMGTLGFLLPFDFKEKAAAFGDVYTSQAKVMNRFRLQCQMSRQNSGEEMVTHAMNDLTIHRGQDPHLSMLEISADGQFVTRAIADGVIVSTPTGSTAYSLSSGGSIVHPSVPCILITPICPRSLSFRPLIFPASSEISLSVSTDSRVHEAELSIDGVRKGTFIQGDHVSVKLEKGHNKGIWCVTRTEDDWVRHLNSLLGFNSMFGNGYRQEL